MQTGTVEDVEKYSKRTVRVTKEHNDECKRLLKLMGVPIIEARCWPCTSFQWLLSECHSHARANSSYTGLQMRLVDQTSANHLQPDL